MNGRIKELRTTLRMNQTDFGNRIGVKQGTVASYESGARTPLDSVVLAICREFNVNEDWLRNGTEPMFVQPDTFDLNEFVKIHGATDLELEILKIYFELDPKIRKSALEFFKVKFAETMIKNPAVMTPDSADLLEVVCPPEEEKKKNDIG